MGDLFACNAAVSRIKRRARFPAPGGVACAAAVSQIKSRARSADRRSAPLPGQISRCGFNRNINAGIADNVTKETRRSMGGFGGSRRFFGTSRDQLPLEEVALWRCAQQERVRRGDVANRTWGASCSPPGARVPRQCRKRDLERVMPAARRAPLGPRQNKTRLGARHARR